MTKLAAIAVEPLLPVYLIGGGDRPKVARALARLRSRFQDTAVELLSAEVASGADAVAACNALGLFSVEGGRLVVVEGVERWRAADIEEVGAYLAQPAPGAVLALVADETPKRSPLVDLCTKQGRVLSFELPKPRELPAWVQAEFERRGTQIDRAAARALVEVVGDDVDGVGVAASAHGDVGELAAAAVFVAVGDVNR